MKETRKRNVCPVHSDILVFWEGESECPFCMLIRANDTLSKRVIKLKEKRKKLQMELNALLPKKKKKRKKDNIPF